MRLRGGALREVNLAPLGNAKLRRSFESRRAVRDWWFRLPLGSRLGFERAHSPFIHERGLGRRHALWQPHFLYPFFVRGCLEQ